MRRPRTIGLVEPRGPFRATGNITVAVPALIANTRMVRLGTPTIAVAPALLDGLAVLQHKGPRCRAQPIIESNPQGHALLHVSFWGLSAVHAVHVAPHDVARARVGPEDHVVHDVVDDAVGPLHLLILVATVTRRVIGGSDLLEPRLIPVPVVDVPLDAIHFRLRSDLGFIAHVRFYDRAVVVELLIQHYHAVVPQIQHETRGVPQVSV
mmetsp:Transcript_15274/g.43505  ORF Transcript_15274/g.43505 Transcript_15274/m.43505 type:complete len:209 (+) Transcript_15274:959-1585(+)